MDKDALDLCGCYPDPRDHESWCPKFNGVPNGYVVVSRHLLDALADAVAESVFAAAPGIVSAAAAVVEAVGPTREDTK